MTLRDKISDGHRTNARGEPVEERPTNLSRRTLLKASAVGASALATTGSVTASAEQATEDDDQDAQVDEPEGFDVEILAGHAPFPDELATTFSLTFANADGEDDGGPVGAHQQLDDEATIIVAEVTWQPGGTSGWHRHPGVVLVSMLEGDVEATWEHDCVPRTYSAGEGFFDPGVIHNVDNLNDDASARAYAIFLGIPDGAPATEWVEPVDC